MSVLHESHFWVRTNGGDIVWCWHCGTRPQWSLAETRCPIVVRRKVSRDLLQGENASAVSQKDANLEMLRAVDAHSGEYTHALYHPRSPYGRDGRRRTGI
jgi:hypothetical protein